MIVSCLSATHDIFRPPEIRRPFPRLPWQEKKTLTVLNNRSCSANLFWLEQNELWMERNKLWVDQMSYEWNQWAMSNPTAPEQDEEMPQTLELEDLKCVASCVQCPFETAFGFSHAIGTGIFYKNFCHLWSIELGPEFMNTFYWSKQDLKLYPPSISCSLQA